MNTTAGGVGHKELSALRRELTGARSSQIARVVAVVDALPERGAADHLIAPLRPRLAQLRPSRPLRFCRLLFTPFDPLIVAGPKWRLGSPSVPRTALEPIAEVVRAKLGPEATEIEALIAGRTMAHSAILAHAGERLWPQAAEILALADAPPAEWSQTGFPVPLYGPLARSVAVVLTRAAELHTLVESLLHGARMPPDAALRLLGATPKDSPDGWAMLLALLMARLPTADTLLRGAIAKGLIGPSSPMRGAAEQAIDMVLGGLETQGGTAGPIASSELSEAGAEVTRILALLRGLDSDQIGFERRRRVHELRQRIDMSCRSRFESGLTGEFVTPLMLLRPGADPAEVTRLEDTARDLRKLEAAARQVNARSGLDAQLQRAAGEIGTMDPTGALGLADRVRMVEILAGSDAALALLDAAA